MRVQRNKGKITIEEPTYARDKNTSSRGKNGKSSGFPKNRNSPPKKW